MSNEYIKSALWKARSNIKKELSELNESALEARQELRYYRSKVKEHKSHLNWINSEKDKLKRELKKTESIEYSINPIKNIHKKKTNENTIRSTE